MKIIFKAVQKIDEKLRMKIDQESLKMTEN